MLVFPLSFLLLPVVVGLGTAYVATARLPDARLRAAARVGILAATGAAPLCTQGPGPAQLILGLLVGYLGIRMVAVAGRVRCEGKVAGDRAGSQLGHHAVLLELVTPPGLFDPAPEPLRRPWLVTLGGCAGVGACVGMLVLGDQWRLWQMSRLGHFLDDQWVVLEVALGAAGVHGLLVGVAQLLGHPVRGLLDHPFRSTSLSEFWGRRWNRMVQINLAAGFYRPLARRGFPTLGLFAAFAASGLFHVVPVLGAGPLREVALPCACVLWSLLGHGAAVLVEQGLGWDRLPAIPRSRALARVRSLFLFLALSPGLIEPLAAVAHVHGRSLARPAAQGDPPALTRGCQVER